MHKPEGLCTTNNFNNFLFPVLSSGTDSQNITIDPDALELCGANFLPGQAISTGNTNLEPPSPEKIYTIAGIYLACMVTACLIVALFVDSSDRQVNK